MDHLKGQLGDHQIDDARKDFALVNWRGRRYDTFIINGGLNMESRQTSEVMRLAVDENNIEAARECSHEEYM